MSTATTPFGNHAMLCMIPAPPHHPTSPRCVLAWVAALAAWLSICWGQEVGHGVDVSWPMHYNYYHDGVARTTSTTHRTRPQQLEEYVKYMNGCYDSFGKDVCDRNEADRIAQNLAQPPYQTNFTSTGYAKIRAPESAFRRLRAFWDEHRGRAGAEYWSEGNIYVNHWLCETKILPVHDPDGVWGMSVSDRRMIMDEVQALLERWGGVPLVPTSMYGIRAYSNGTIVSAHVDRLPFVISAVINVAQDVNEEWILEIIGHDRKAVNITMAPGDLTIYESSSVIHGRPYRLAGQYYADLFLHYEPIGYTEQIERKMRANTKSISSKEKFRISLDRKQQPLSKVETTRLPPYINEDTKEAVQWMQRYLFFRDEKNRNRASNAKVTVAHVMAAVGDHKALRLVGFGSPELLHGEDSNGWRPIHEAARSGHSKVVEYLIEEGVDLNQRTNEGEGGTALWWAEHMLPHDHPVIQLLRRHGAVAVGPGE